MVSQLYFGLPILQGTKGPKNEPAHTSFSQRKLNEEVGNLSVETNGAYQNGGSL